MTDLRTHWMSFNQGIVLGLFALCTCTAHAQTPPYSLFQYATLTGSGNTITASSIPVVISAGVTVYLNVSIQFNVDNNGNLTVATGYPQVTSATPQIASSFLAGNYTGPTTVNGGKNFITVSGPGVTAGGATEWTLTATTGASPSTYPASATWYVGPVANNPYATRVANAGITTTAYSYGVTGSNTGISGWQANTLIGVSQVGNSITFVSFTEGGVDKSLPVDQITYTLNP